MQAQQFGSIHISGLEKITLNQKAIQQINSNNVRQKTNVLIADIVERGYLACSLDSIHSPDSLNPNLKLFFYLGEQYNWTHLHFSDENKQLIEQSGYADKLYSDKPFKPAQVKVLFEKILFYLENNGYPFAQVYLDSIRIHQSTVSASLKINKGPLILIESIFLKGDDAIDKNLLHTLIQTNEGDVFNQRIINDISTRIKETPYLEEIRPAEYEFIGEKCNLYVYVRNKNANSFNAILGILPSDNGKINITGDARIKLVNTLRKGELLDLNWRKLLPLTQNLNIQANYPFLFRTNFGIESKFDLYKKDTSYIDLNIRLGISYYINPYLKLTGFYNARRSDLLSTIPYQFNTTLPSFADISINSYGVVINWSRLNYKYNPTKGAQVEITTSAGAKKIRKNANLNEIVYENVNLNTSNYRSEIIYDYFIPLKKRSTLKLGINSGFIINSTIFENELFRLGGNRTIRGFDEESIFASSFAIGIIEFRYLLEENSNLFAFYENAWLEKKLQSSYSNSTLYSFGAGINFQTKPGIFSISYALGALTQNPLLLRSAKIHFGFINYF